MGERMEKGGLKMGSVTQKTRERIARMLGEKDVHVLDNAWIRR